MTNRFNNLCDLGGQTQTHPVTVENSIDIAVWPCILSSLFINRWESYFTFNLCDRWCFLTPKIFGVVFSI